MSQPPSYRGYRFPPEIISHAVWLYHRFGLSFRDVEDLLAERGVSVTYESIRQWCLTRSSCRFEDESISRESVRPPTSHSPIGHLETTGRARQDRAGGGACHAVTYVRLLTTNSGVGNRGPLSWSN